MKSLLVLKLSRLTYNGLLNLANAVHAGLTGASGTYTTPFPTLVSLSSQISSYAAALSIWEDKVHRSHADRIVLLAERDALRDMLTQLSWYCENTTPYDAVSLALTGFSLKKEPEPMGKFQPVQNLRQVKHSKKVVTGQLVIRWNRPANGTHVKIDGYRVFRSDTSSYAQAEELDMVGTNYFVDTNPGEGYRWYWVIAFSSATGNGDLSDVCMAIATPLPA